MSKAWLRRMTVVAALLAAPGFLFVTIDALFRVADAPPTLVETLERGPERAGSALRGAGRALRAGGARLAGDGERRVPTPAEPSLPARAPGPEAMAVPILVYHNIREPGVRSRVDDQYFVTPAQFEAQLAYLRDAGYVSASFDDLAAAFGGGAFPAKPVILTFDDGRDSQYEKAFPLLKKYGFTATFFVFTNAIGRPGYLTWDQLREMRAAGMAVASHSVFHPYLMKADDETLRREVTDSKATLEKGLGATVTTFAYPFGLYDERVTRAVRDAGYVMARGLRHSAVARGDGLFDLPGWIAVGDLAAFRAVVEGRR